MSTALASSPFTTGTRRHKRIPLRVPMRFCRTDGSGEEYDGTSTDVSVGGLGAVVDADFEVGEILDCYFVCPEYDSTCYRAQVVYRHDQHYGMYLLRC